MHIPAEQHPPQYEQSTGTEPGRQAARAPLWRGLPSAVTFLTITPIPGAAPDGLAAAAGWFPLVGAAIGALAASVRLGTEQVLGRGPATVLATIALVVLTGALHQDGLADTADGLGARGQREQRLAAMRDPATGAFGTLALIGWAALILATLGSLDALHVLIALTVACALARWAALLHATTVRPARSDGLGAALHPSCPALASATVASVALSFALSGLVAGTIATGVALLLAGLSALLASRTLGGRTGDTLGATIAMTEAVVCVALLAVWHG